MTTHVFISYSGEDEEVARELAHNLARKGVEAWFDRDELKPGESWKQQIKRALNGSDAVVVVLGAGGPRANVLVEAGMAMGQGKKILPVIVDEKADVDVFSKLRLIRATNEDEIDTAADQVIAFVAQETAARL